MNYIQLVSFVLQLALFHSAQGKKICDFADSECTTLAANNIYKSVVTGIEGVVKSSDPLRLSEINEDQPNLKYHLSNATLSGMANCEVTLLKLNHENLTYEYNLRCPQLVLHQHCNIEGFLGTAEVNGKGLVTVTLNDYIINFKGKYGHFISDKDHKQHFSPQEYDVEFEPKGKFLVDFQGPLHSDEAKSDVAKTYMSEHVDDIERMMRSPALKRYMAQFHENLDAYLRFTPIEDMLFRP